MNLANHSSFKVIIVDSSDIYESNQKKIQRIIYLYNQKYRKQITLKDLMSRSRHTDVVIVRYMVIWYLVNIRYMTYEMAGNFVNRHHSSVTHALNSTKKIPFYQKFVKEIFSEKV